MTEEDGRREAVRGQVDRQSYAKRVKVFEVCSVE
jgi:hypothetical protein